MRLELFGVRRRWPRQRTQRDDERGFVNSGILFLLPSVQFVGLILPSNSHAETWTRLHASAIFFDIWRSGCVTFASLEWPVWSSSSGNNCHAVHRSLSSGASLWSGTFTLSHIISRAHLCDFFQLLTIGMCHFRYLRNGRCDRHRAKITIMQFIGHSLPGHHFFYSTVRIFTLSHIVSQAVFYIIFLPNSWWITLPTLSCVVLYYFCVSFLYSLIMWLMFSSLSSHNLHLLFSVLLLNTWFLWRYFVLLLEEIHILFLRVSLSKSISRSSRDWLS